MSDPDYDLERLRAKERAYYEAEERRNNPLYVYRMEPLPFMTRGDVVMSIFIGALSGGLIGLIVGFLLGMWFG